MMALLIYSLPIFLCIVQSQCEQQSFTYRASKFCDEESNMTAKFELETVTNNVIECARLCSKHTGCDGTIFHENNKTCIGVKKENESDGTNSCAPPGATYYKLASATVVTAVQPTAEPTISGYDTHNTTTAATDTAAVATSNPATSQGSVTVSSSSTTAATDTVAVTNPASTTSQALTTTAAATAAAAVATTVTSVEFTCPPDDTVFRPVTLSDGTQFSFRIFLDTPRAFSQAVNKCDSHGSTVWEVVTNSKFNFTQQLMACPAYTTLNFWTNGVYNASTSTWETLTGKPIPMTSDFWYPDRPNSGGNRMCVWLWAPFGHYMDDYDCETPAYDIYTICEILH